MKKVLMTGFEPFGGESINPALEAVKRLDGKKLDGGEVIICQVPVTRYESINTVVNAIEQYQPDIVITVGRRLGVQQLRRNVWRSMWMISAFLIMVAINPLTSR